MRIFKIIYIKNNLKLIMSLTTSLNSFDKGGLGNQLSPGNFSAFNCFQQFKEKNQKDQVFHFKTNTCIEKPKFNNIKFNNETQNEIKEIRENYYNPKIKEPTSFGQSLAKTKNISQSVNSLSSINGFGKTTNSNIIDTSHPRYFCSNNLRTSFINESYPTILPQWIKNDKIVLKFNGYFNEHIVESNVENYRIRACDIYYYLEDDTIQVIELKTENSGIPQGTIVKRQKIKKNPNEKNENIPIEYYNYTDLKVGNQITIFGKRFKICNCDAFTKKFMDEKQVEMKEPEKVPEYINPNYEKVKAIDNSENIKNIADYKEFCEVKLGGGHPNKVLKNFLNNDRKVLSFDILWDDYEQDKEMKQYKMNYYLAENMVEVRELNENNSGRQKYPYLLKKSFLPKNPEFFYCPGLNKREYELYEPKDLILGNYVHIFGRPCFIFDCDDFTKRWYKEK